VKLSKYHYSLGVNAVIIAPKELISIHFGAIIKAQKLHSVLTGAYFVHN